MRPKGCPACQTLVVDVKPWCTQQRRWPLSVRGCKKMSKRLGMTGNGAGILCTQTTARNKKERDSAPSGATLNAFGPTSALSPMDITVCSCPRTARPSSAGRPLTLPIAVGLLGL